MREPRSYDDYTLEIINRLTRERDAAQAECRAWRAFNQAPIYKEHILQPELERAVAAHDTACPGWEKEK